jgi:hypothetical protein
MHSALTGVQVLVTSTPEHAYRLAHFFWGLLYYCDDRERDSIIEISNEDVRSLWLLFSVMSFCDNRERIFIFYYDTKEKEHQNTWQSDLYSRVGVGGVPPRTNQIALCLGALSIT